MAYTENQIETIFNTICERIEKGESLRSVLRSDNMPSSQTFYVWLDNDDIKSKQYARATSLRADDIFDEIIEISDNVEQDIITLPDGREVENKAVIARDRLRVDTRKWALSKMNPKKYGDKLDVTTKDKPIESNPNINLIVEGKTINMKEESKE